MPVIFLSYRRDDTEGYAGRLYEALTAALPGARVFLDVDHVAPGEDFVDTLDRMLSSCDVMLALIGRNWLTATDADGQRRLDKANDFVRLEIARALARQVRVVPVLVQEAKMPAPADLPDLLKGLSRRQACELRHTRWGDDVRRLIAVVEESIEKAGPAVDAQGTDHVPSLRASTSPKPEIEQIGRYQVLGSIAYGSVSVVYRAYDRASDRHVALKILAKSLGDSEIRSQFRRELSMGARLHHPNIMSIFEVGEHEGRPFAAMELIDGENLAQFISRRAPVMLVRRLAIAEDICAALAYAHSLGVVHREVKPSSVLLPEDGHVKLLNFGLTQSANLTGGGGLTIILGTPHYQSPELILGRQFDHRTDIFSFGAVLYELISYEKPFTGASFTVMYQIVNDPPRPLHEFVPDIDLQLEGVVERALQKDPARRYQDIRTLQRDLVDIRERLQM